MTVTKGGYNLDSISECALAVTKTLLGEPPDRLKAASPSQLAIQDVNLVMKRQARYWSCLSDFRQGPGSLFVVHGRSLLPSLTLKPRPD